MKPPHMRGKVACADQTIQPDGITPAWAGKSLFCFTAAVPIQDHPRMGGEKLSCISLLGELLESPPQCGEKCCLRFGQCFQRGSPPHRRGKESPRAVLSALLGITPAQAGKRKKGGSPEKSGLGSPPHRRGKVIDSIGIRANAGITPAWAGKRSDPSCG